MPVVVAINRLRYRTPGTNWHSSMKAVAREFAVKLWSAIIGLEGGPGLKI